MVRPKQRLSRLEKTRMCRVKIQSDAGGDALIGRRLYPLLYDAGYTDVAVSPRMVYVDASRPARVADLYPTTRAGGTFCYTFFKGLGTRP